MIFCSNNSLFFLFSFTAVVKKFLGNAKPTNFVQFVKNMLFKFENLGVKMSIKISHLFYRLDRFTENLRELKEKQDERFRQEIRFMEERYQEKCETYVITDYCWNLQQHKPFLILQPHSLTRSDLFHRFNKTE